MSQPEEQKTPTSDAAEAEPRAQQPYTIGFYIEEPAGAVYRAEAPSTTLIRDMAADFFEERGWPGWPRQRAVTERIDSENSERTERMNPNQTLHDAGVRDADTLRVLPESVAGCFPGDTLISLADGRYLPIEQVQTGDQVRTFHPIDKRFEVAQVREVITEESTEHLFINQSLRITKSQLIFSNGACIPAENVLVGDRLATEDGSEITVVTIQLMSEVIQVYHLRLDSRGMTFFANGFLVTDYRAKQVSLNLGKPEDIRGLTWALEDMQRMLEVLPIEIQPSDIKNPLTLGRPEVQDIRALIGVIQHDLQKLGETRLFRQVVTTDPLRTFEYPHNNPSVESVLIFTPASFSPKDALERATSTSFWEDITEAIVHASLTPVSLSIADLLLRNKIEHTSEKILTPFNPAPISKDNLEYKGGESKKPHQSNIADLLMRDNLEYNILTALKGASLAILDLSSFDADTLVCYAVCKRLCIPTIVLLQRLNQMVPSPIKDRCVFYGSYPETARQLRIELRQAITDVHTFLIGRNTHEQPSELIRLKELLMATRQRLHLIQMATLRSPSADLVNEQVELERRVGILQRRIDQFTKPNEQLDLLTRNALRIA